MKEKNIKSKMLLQVHDELIFDVKDELPYSVNCVWFVNQPQGELRSRSSGSS